MAEQITLKQALERAAQHAKEGRLVEAEQIYRQLIAAAPGRAELNVNLGRLLYAQKRWALAIEQFEQALAFDPGMVSVYRNLGFANAQLQKFPEAIAHFENALKFTPEDAPEKASILYDLALTLFTQRDIENAQEKARQVLERDPEHAAAHFLLGVVAEEESDLDNAIMHYKRAVELRPEFPQAENNLGIAKRYVRKTDAELRALQEQAAENPQNPAAYFEWVFELWEQRRDQEAADALATAHARWPKNLTADYFEGLLKDSMGNQAQALKAFAKACKVDPDDALIAYAEEGIKLTQRKKKPPKKAKRVALHLNQKFHAAILGPVFDALKKRHPVLMTAHLRNLIDFEPDVIVTAETHSAFLRHYLPKADFVGVRHGLISKKKTYNAARMNDFFCVTSEANRDWYVAQKSLPRKDFWITGYVQMDPLFRGDSMPIPIKIPKNHKTVLYAPTWNEDLSSASLLGKRVAELICGERDDITLIIKAHPVTVVHTPAWIAAWREIAQAHKHVHLVEPNDANVMPYLAAADVLVSDISSVIFQYLAVDRPIVLITNPKALTSSMRDPAGVEWTHRDVGEQVADVAGISFAVDRALGDPTWGAEGRRRGRDYLFGDLTDGKAAFRIAEQIKALED